MPLGAGAGYTLPTAAAEDPAYSPLCGQVGLRRVLGPGHVLGAVSAPPRAALAQADIVSGSFRGAGTAFGGSRLAVTNGIEDWSNFAGFTIAGWLKPIATANTNSTLFDCYVHGANNNLVRVKRYSTTNNLEFLVQVGSSSVSVARTDSNPWAHGVWAHYAITFSAGRALSFYKSGALLQFDVVTDSGGSTPNNVTTHTFNTAIPSAPRNCAYLFGGSATASNDDYGGEALNFGYWNTALSAAEIAVLAGTSKLDLAANSGAYVSSSNLRFNPKFATRSGGLSYVVLPTVGLDAYSVEIGPTVP